jgi:tRNA A-37 threonylcarbamoyl transferase component Bud32
MKSNWVKSNWISGDADLTAAIDRWFEDPGQHGGEILTTSGYRRIVRLELESAPSSIVIKEFFSDRARPNSAGRAIAGLRRLVGQSPAEREWRGLQRIHAAGISVPKPLAYARRAGGGALIVTPFLEGARSLDLALDGYAFEQRRIMRSVGKLIFSLHEKGFVHGDLHTGNILVGEKGPVLIDLQRIREDESQAAANRDIAFLDFSLYQLGVSRSNRLRFRIAAIHLGHFRVASERERLREIGRASQMRALDYYRGRTRRTLRAGEAFRAVTRGNQSGLRRAGFSEEALQAALEAHQTQVDTRGPQLIKCDHRARVSCVRALGHEVVVKEVVESSARKRLADVFRGSAGRRAWVGGHGLQIRGIPAATPLAYLETKRWGVPIASLVVLEDLSSARCSAELKPGDPEAQHLPKLLLRLVTRLHRTGSLHADLQAMHIYLVKHGEETELSLIDLEGVRFPGRLRDQQRIQMLSEVNATFDDDLIGASVRARIFEQYVQNLPFDLGNARALKKIVQRSLARKQRWQGRDCSLSQGSR